MTLYEERNQLYRGSASISDPLDEEVDIWQTIWELEYAIDERWSVSATFRYLDMDHKLEAVGTRNRVSGVADTLVAAHWMAWDSGVSGAEVGGGSGDARFRLALDAGLLFPTGRPRSPSLVPSGAPYSVLQTGTGTFVPTGGATLSVDWGGFVGSLAVEATFPFYENRHRFQPGSYQRVALDGLVRPTDTLGVGVQLELEHTGRDEIDGRNVAVGGGWRLSVSPHVRWQTTDHLALFGGLQIPVWRDFDTSVLDSTWRAHVGGELRF